MAILELDPLDLAILRALRRDARRSFRDLAEALGSTTPTVSARVKALEELGVLRGYHADVTGDALGGRWVVVRIRTSPAAASGVAEAVAGLPGVGEVLVLAGGGLEARLRAAAGPGTTAGPVADADANAPASTTTAASLHGEGPGALARLHAALAGLPEVTGYEVHEVLHAIEPAPQEEVPSHLDVPCHLCRGPIHGPGQRHRFGERMHVFCCRQCLADFRARYERHAAKKGPA